MNKEKLPKDEFFCKKYKKFCFSLQSVFKIGLQDLIVFYA